MLCLQFTRHQRQPQERIMGLAERETPSLALRICEFRPSKRLIGEALRRGLQTFIKCCQKRIQQSVAITK